MRGSGSLSGPLLTSCWGFRAALRNQLPVCAVSGRAVCSSVLHRHAPASRHYRALAEHHSACQRRLPRLPARCLSQAAPQVTLIGSIRLSVAPRLSKLRDHHTAGQHKCWGGLV